MTKIRERSSLEEAVGLYEARDLDGALNVINRLLQLGTDSADIRLLRGNIFFNKSDYRGAEQEYRTGLKINPDDDNLHYNLGLALCEQGIGRGAHEHIKRAYELLKSRESK